MFYFKLIIGTFSSDHIVLSIPNFKYLKHAIWPQVTSSNLEIIIFKSGSNYINLQKVLENKLYFTWKYFFSYQTKFLDLSTKPAEVPGPETVFFAHVWIRTVLFSSIHIQHNCIFTYIFLYARFLPKTLVLTKIPFQPDSIFDSSLETEIFFKIYRIDMRKSKF